LFLTILSVSAPLFTLITSQLPIDQWHAYLGDRSVADAILDRLTKRQF
jgi:hypothetical protein